jgi:hypothetical protein
LVGLFSGGLYIFPTLFTVISLSYLIAYEGYYFNKLVRFRWNIGFSTNISFSDVQYLAFISCGAIVGVGLLGKGIGKMKNYLTSRTKDIVKKE